MRLPVAFDYFNAALVRFQATFKLLAGTDGITVRFHLDPGPLFANRPGKPGLDGFDYPDARGSYANGTCDGELLDCARLFTVIVRFHAAIFEGTSGTDKHHAIYPFELCVESAFDVVVVEAVVDGHPPSGFRFEMRLARID